jgi:hypothetical protein
MDSPPVPLRLVKSITAVSLLNSCMPLCTSALNHETLDRPVNDSVLVGPGLLPKWREALLASA